MSVYKEGYHIIDQLDKGLIKIQQPHGHHLGTPTSKGDVIWKAVNQLVTWYKVRDIDTRRTSTSDDSKILSEIIMLGSENSKRPEEHYYRVTYVSQPNSYRMDGFILITSTCKPTK